MVKAPPSPTSSASGVLDEHDLSCSAPTSFILPDLVSHCRFQLCCNPHGEQIAHETVRWLDEGFPELSQKKRAKLYGLKAGELTAMTYPFCDAEHLRATCDFLNWLFHSDDVGDDLVAKETDELADVVMNAFWFPRTHVPKKEMSVGRLARDFWSRCLKDAGPGVQARFKENMELFFEAVNQQTKDRDDAVIPDLESYIDVRRDTSGCKPSFDLIEYAMKIDLPDHVVNHPVIKALNQGSNDLVTWSNDIFSYNKEQARGDTHNMIPIMMAHYGMDLQEAVDYVGEMCRLTIDTFALNKRRVPSFGCPKLDRDVATYVQGLQDWIVGSLHWSFMTERYFGKEGAEVKKHRYVKLLPRKVDTVDLRDA